MLSVQVTAQSMGFQEEKKYTEYVGALKASSPHSQPHPLLLHPQPLSYEELFLFDEFNHSPARNETKGAEKARGMIKRRTCSLSP